MWFIMLCKMALGFKSVDETLAHVTIQMKAIELHLHVVLIISRAPAAQSSAPAWHIVPRAVVWPCLTGWCFT